LGFALVTLHTAELVIPSPRLDFTRYNPRIPPKDAVSLMSKKMKKVCSSEEHYLKAAVSRTSVKNLNKLLSTYSTQEYATIPNAEFSSTATVFFLTGGTRNEASGRTFQNLLGSKKKQKKTAQVVQVKGGRGVETLSRSDLLFKVANWVVQLYDFGMYLIPSYSHAYILYLFS
jgi:hypothetical protein